MPQVDKTCPHCQSVFACHTWHKKKFCSAGCRSVGRARGWKSPKRNFRLNAGNFKPGMVPWNKTDGVILNCPCGTSIRLQPNEAGRKFCSKACAYKWRVLKGTFQNGHADMVPADKRGHTAETRQKISVGHRRLMRRGELNPNWRGGRRKERSVAMGRFEYKDWRKAVFERDNYTCQACKVRGGYLEADHIKPWSLHPDLRYDVSNGRTLCRSCHQATDTWGSRALMAA